MKPSLLEKALPAIITSRIPYLLSGPPGVGKSQIIGQVVGKMGLQLIDLRLVDKDPVDLTGLPRFDEDGTVRWGRPWFLPRDGAGVIFIDEITSADEAVQKPCLQLVHDRRIGEHVLPDGWAVLAAGNREWDLAGAKRLISSLNNRFAHGELDIDLTDWCLWADRAGIMTEIIAFLRYREGLLHDFDPRSDTFDPARRAYATPRSWELASNMFRADPPAEAQHELLEGIVGEAPATEFMGFLKVAKSLPSPDAILLNPMTATVPDQPSTQLLVTQALAKRATPDNFDRVCAYANRLPVEFNVRLVNEAKELEPSVQNTRAFNVWAAENHQALN